MDKKQVSVDLVNAILDVFVPVFISKEVDASSQERYTSQPNLVSPSIEEERTNVQ